MTGVRKPKSPLRGVTKEEVCQRVLYDVESGIFTNRYGGHGLEKGREAGYVCGVGYRRICVKGRQYLAHRLAWLIVYGEWADFVDHKNGDRSDNRISNLRSCSASQNIANSKRSASNKSGFKGVYFSAKSKKWCADIRVNFNKVYLGAFDTPEDAHIAYQVAAKRLFGEFARAA